jgi:chromosome segregation ATPase
MESELNQKIKELEAKIDDLEEQPTEVTKKWDGIKDKLAKEENILNLADGGYWDKQVQTLPEDRCRLTSNKLLYKLGGEVIIIN